jgi:hypothetical protein
MKSNGVNRFLQLPLSVAACRLTDTTRPASRRRLEALRVNVLVACENGANVAMFSGVSREFVAWLAMCNCSATDHTLAEILLNDAAVLRSQNLRTSELMQRILLTGDFLRPLQEDSCQSESVRRIRWFEDLLGPPLSVVTDLPVQRLACDDTLTLAGLYADAGLTPSLDAWAELFAGPIEDRLANRIIDLCRDAIVISIELPPSVAQVLHSAGIPLIDAAVDAHRFLYDIPLAWRSTVATVREAIEPFRVSSFEIRRRAAQVKAKARWLSPIDVPPRATLVLDQVATDSAMIDPVRRRRVNWDDYRNALDRLKRCGPIVWRPHPSNAQAGAISELLGEGTQSTANIYQLLSHDDLTGVAAISSGGVLEARAFGKEGIHFMDRYAGIALEGWRDAAPVVGHWLSPHFWSAVLAPFVETRRHVPTLTVEKDFFRRTVNCDWGFGWIDQVVIR